MVIESLKHGQEKLCNQASPSNLDEQQQRTFHISSRIREMNANRFACQRNRPFMKIYDDEIKN